MKKMAKLAVAVMLAASVATGCGAKRTVVKNNVTSKTEMSPEAYRDFLDERVASELDDGDTMHCDVTYKDEDKTFYIVTGTDNLAAVATGASAGDATCLQYWRKLERTAEKACKNVYNNAVEKCGDDYNVALAIYDTGTNSDSLLTIINGEITYDEVDDD